MFQSSGQISILSKNATYELYLFTQIFLKISDINVKKNSDSENRKIIVFS